MGSTQRRGIELVSWAIGLAIVPSVAHGEPPSIVPAGDGVGTTVQQQGNQYDIGGGTRSGDNLFHSFQRLGLSSQEIANFLATPDLRAIVGRVTGGDPSVLEGLIRVSGGRPNLFLMNPAGIIFGEGARLDVPGSFGATTASSLGFSNGGWFPAIGPVDFAALGGSLQALEFASDRPGSVVNLGNLTVPAGENLWLIGGGAAISTGTVQTPGGNVVVAAIPGTNRVRIAPDGSTLTLEVVLPQPGTIGGRSLAELLVGPSAAGAARLVTNPDGSVSLRSADSLTLVPLPDRGAIVSGAIDTASTTGRGGSITVTGDRVGLLGARLDASGSLGGGRVNLGGSDQGDGNIFSSIITLVDRHSQIAANATGLGPGGRIIVWADGVTWFGGAIEARGGPNGGDGGFAEVSGKQELAMRGTADLSAPLGQLGTLLLDPRDILIVPTSFAVNDVELLPNVPFGQAEGQILLNDLGSSTLPGAVDFTISEGRLESLQGNVNIVLVAERDILVENLPDNVLDLKTEASGSVRFRAGRDLRFSDTNDLLSTRGGAVTIQADGAVTIGPINTSGGAVTLSAATGLIANTITTAGGAINLFSTGDGISTGAIASGGGALSMVAPNNITTGSLTTQGGNANLTSSSGAIATGPIDSSGNQAGGFVSLNGNAGVTVNGNLQAIGNNSSGGGVDLRSTGPIAVNGDVNTSAPVVGRGGDITFNTSGNSATVTGQLQSTGNIGGAISLTAQGAIAVSNLNTSGRNNAAGNVTLISQTAGITGGNLNASSSSQGGTLQGRAITGITLGSIDLSGAIGNGGNSTLTLLGPGDIQFTSLNAQGGPTGTGGAVEITTTRFFRALGTFIDRTGILASIATGGGQGGNRVRITHGGGSQDPRIPLVVGQNPGSTGNGLTGAVTTGSSTVSTGSFPGVFTQGNIEFVTTPEPIPTPSPTPTPTPTPTPSPSPTPTPTPTPSPSPSPTPTPSPSPSPTPTPSPSPSPTPTPTPTPTPSPSPTPSPTAQADRADRESERTVQQWPLGSGQIRRQDLDAIEQAARRNIVARLNGGATDAAVVEIDRLYTTLTNTYLGRAISNDVQSVPELQSTLQALQSKTGLKPAILYTFARPEQLDVILVVPDAPPIYRTLRDAPRDRVLKAVENLRAAITSPVARISNTYRPPAEQLYRWIVGPVAEELVRHKVDTIAFSMDRGMRSLPVSVLHDGKQFLIEQYSVGLIPSVNLTDTEFQPIRSAPVLSFGASQFSDLPPLPAVPIELATIQQLMATDKTFLNEAFSLSNLKRQRRSNPYPILHMATHADFRPGAPDNSFVRLWDQRLAMSELRQLGLSNPPVELLVLSACRTAIGDESAELGFAGFAVDAGVKSVVASLWYVSDEGTLGLMASFYDALRSAPIKAEALRRAQLAMLRGQTRAEDGKLVFPGGRAPLPAELGSSATFSLAHPYYWASFTTIGSPW